MSLIPRQIVDKNGKMTTVHINPDKNNPISERSFPAPIIAMREEVRVGEDTKWQVAPEGKTAYGCYHCGTFYTAEERIEHEKPENHGDCFVCGEYFMNTDAEVAVLPSSIQYFDKDTVRSSLWYHATATSDWHNNVNTGEDETTAIVHLGTLESAIARAKWINEFEEPGEEHEWTIHVVSLEPNIPIADEVIADDDFEPLNVAKARTNPRYEADGATRYVNRYEETGSISLAINAEKIKVIGALSIDDNYATSEKN
jgi:hypothetical protein